MSNKPEADLLDILRELFSQLRRRQFPLGSDDFQALRQALRAGFGWSSREDLRDLCCTLWAKSRREKEIVEVLYDQFGVPEWSSTMPESGSPPVTPPLPDFDDQGPIIPGLEPLPFENGERPAGGLPSISFEKVELPNYPLVLAPQFPLAYRQVAQAWRRLRQPVRQGAPTELDVEATVERRCRLGIISDVVLVPRRRNTARLLLLVDRRGSMLPFHHFADEVCAAIQQAGNLENVARYYFHDAPARGADEAVLAPLSNQLFPVLDTILPEIPPLSAGSLYNDPRLLSPQALDKVLETHAEGAAVVLLSDAGAARGYYDLVRLLNTVAFLKALRIYTTRYVWLNPLPRARWANSTAAEIARHAPMFPLDQAGMYRAVNVLRGQPFPMERPL